MSSCRHASFDRDPDQIRSAALWVERAAADLGLRDSDPMRMALIMEELFANTLDHGRPGGGAIEIRLDREADAVRMDYRDPGEAFNPLAVDVPETPDIDRWPVGGMGLRLVHRLAARTAYSFENGVNVISLWLRPS